jgi:hypothetical protein
MVTIKKAESPVDVRADLEWLYDLQRTRVGKLAAAEATHNPELRKEEKLFADMLKQLTEFYFAIGELKKAPRTTTVKNEGATTVIESPGRTHVMVSLEQQAQLQKARASLYALIEQERKDMGPLQ